jgi:hypothetical protein
MSVGRFVVAVLVGLVLIDMTGPAITRHKPSPALYFWLAAAVLLVGALFLLLWHRRRMTELRKEWLLSDDWTKVPTWSRNDFWACPRCGTVCPSIAAAEQHLDVETSPCAALRDHRDRLDAEGAQRKEKDRIGAGWPAGIVGENYRDEQDPQGGGEAGA